jgi:hypothetical protein
MPHYTYQFKLVYSWSHKEPSILKVKFQRSPTKINYRHYSYLDKTKV